MIVDIKHHITHYLISGFVVSKKVGGKGLLCAVFLFSQGF